jgi:hypothetical protein
MRDLDPFRNTKRIFNKNMLKSVERQKRNQLLLYVALFAVIPITIMVLVVLLYHS